MSVVVDASTIVGILLPDEGGEYAEAVANRLLSQGGRAPALISIEVANALLQAERRRRIGEGSARSFTEQFERIGLFVDHDFRIDKTIELARRRGLTVYDSCYLELALRLGLPLASLDARLLAAVVAEGGSRFAIG